MKCFPLLASHLTSSHRIKCGLYSRRLHGDDDADLVVVLVKTERFLCKWYEWPYVSPVQSICEHLDRLLQVPLSGQGKGDLRITSW